MALIKLVDTKKTLKYVSRRTQEAFNLEERYKYIKKYNVFLNLYTVTFKNN
jgi:hypothetical protein